MVLVIHRHTRSGEKCNLPMRMSQLRLNKAVFCRLGSAICFFPFFNWSIIASQRCVGFYCTTKCISYMYTHIPSLVQLLCGKYVSFVRCVFATFFPVLCISLVISLFEMSPKRHAALLAG